MMVESVVTELSNEYITQLHSLYQKEWWSKTRTLEETKACVSNSLCFGLVRDETLVAFARVITDFTFKAIIFDVIVRKEYRGMGLSTNLLERIKQDPRIKDVKSKELYCLPEMEQFYENQGFSANFNGRKLLLMHNT
mmetsp:Transcript_14152/g.16114  ORF Transcript_14152/g.16114 Transcript_14152/m.16114 type:complete len:137 (-) Transcript_14152:75-485(-)